MDLLSSRVSALLVMVIGGGGAITKRESVLFIGTQ
jgi:hypothetical protein